MASETVNVAATFTASGALDQFLRVKLDASQKLAAAGLNDVEVGTLLEEAFADGDRRAVRLANAYGTRKMVASEAISAGSRVFGAAAGKVADTASDRFVGIALEAATADNDVIEVLYDPDLAADGVAHQPTPTAESVDATLTAAELRTRIITVNQAAAGTSSLTLPLATAMDDEFPDVPINGAVEFSLINTSTVAGEDATLITNTGWTLVGEMTVESNDADRARSSGLFRARRTAADTWTLYRIA